MTEGAYAQGRLFFERDGTLMAQALDVDRARTIGDAIPVVAGLLAGTNEGAFAFSLSEMGPSRIGPACRRSASRRS